MTKTLKKNKMSIVDKEGTFLCSGNEHKTMQGMKISQLVAVKNSKSEAQVTSTFRAEEYANQ
jgi:uncharacterized protein (DUF1330 family)